MRFDGRTSVQDLVRAHPAASGVLARNGLLDDSIDGRTTLATLCSGRNDLLERLLEEIPVLGSVRF